MSTGRKLLAFVTLALALAPSPGRAETVIPKGKWVIALSNSYYGNTWRKQMVQAFTDAAEQAKKAGYIKDYVIVNGDGTQNTQIAQMNSLILKGVNAIAINAASPTALNGVIDQAAKNGIKILAFDSIATSPQAKKMDFDFVGYGTAVAEYAAKRLDGKGTVLQIRGVSGSAPDQQMFQGQVDILGKNPGIKVASIVNGEASATVAQSAISNILPSLAKIDAVLTQGGGDAFGAVQAFQASGKPMPIIVGDNTSEFIHWWLEQKKANGYETIGICSTPGIGGAALWVSLAMLNGVAVPENMKMALVKVTQADVENYATLKPGTIASPSFTYEEVMEKIVKAGK
jgi:ribose transport system substrate-binding protein